MQQKEPLSQASVVILAMFAYLTERKFHSEPKKVQEIFYQACTSYKIIKEYLPFQPSTVCRYSRELARSFEQLRDHKIIDYAVHSPLTMEKNPLFYVITEDGMETAKYMSHIFNVREREELQSLAEFFQRECGVPEPKLEAAPV